MHRSTAPGRRSVLAVLALVFLATGSAIAALVGDHFEGGPGGTLRSADTRLALPVAIPDEVETVRPALRATLPEGVSEQVLQQVSAVPGVKAAARVLLAHVVVEVPGGDAQVSLAAVDPDEFRPLAPESTAQARFVWEGLHRSQMLIAHEQYQMFGGKPLQTLAARGPGGRSILTVGGLASSGVPNLAGALTSLEQAGDLGLTNPTMLIVGLEDGAVQSEVKKALSEALPDTTFEPLGPSNPQSFHSGAAAQRAIGSFRYLTNEDGTISQDPRWVSQHITSQTVPLLGRVRCHRVMMPQLQAALAEIEAAGLAGAIKPEQYGGCYVPRFIERDGSRPLSMHAWGLAIDINVADNPVGARPNLDPGVVAIFEKWGFRWGGRWSPPDGHHFELAALLQE